MEELEDQAFDLLREVVTKGRNGEPYKHLLPKLEELLDACPQLASSIAQALPKTDPVPGIRSKRYVV